jgi:epoxyqueuosine reductase
MALRTSGMGAGSFMNDPALFVERAIGQYVRESPSNALRDLGGGPIFDEPLVGFADGDDQIFRDYKRIIGDHHLTPREVMAVHRPGVGLARVSVVSFIMPISQQTRFRQRRETRVPSLQWNRTRWHGQDFIYELSRHVVSLLEGLGHQAVVPETAAFHKVDVRAFTSNWSQRHVAYAAGLGTFGLTDGLLTPKGLAMRCGSVVTDAVFKPTLRRYKDHYAACLFYQGKGCGRCIARCPAGAITEKGHDKVKCMDYLNVRQREIVKELGREAEFIGRYPGCGLCQTKVPCEAGIPAEVSLLENSS